jgi:hypothetical protein
MMRDMAPETVILLFVLFGLALVGLASLVLAVYIGLQRITTPKPPPPTFTKTRWERDWEAIEENLRGDTL